MRRLAIFSLALYSALVVGVGAALLAGSIQPISKSVATYHLADCEHPCWIGIIPGKTSREEVRMRVVALLRSLPGYSFNNETFRYDSLRFTLRDAKHKREVMIDVTCLTHDEVVSSCAIGWNPDLEVGVPTLTDLQSLLGKPDSVSWSPGIITQIYGDAYHGTALLALANWMRPNDR